MSKVTIPSPCIAVCQLDPASGVCIGCLRTATEIQAWPAADSELRLEILARLKDRRRAAGRTSAADQRPRRRENLRRRQPPAAAE